MEEMITANKAFHPYGAQSAPRVNADVQRPEISKNYGEIATATATEENVREKVRAMPRKMNITAKNGLKIEKMGSASPKTRFSGLFFDFSGLQA